MGDEVNLPLKRVLGLYRDYMGIMKRKWKLLHYHRVYIYRYIYIYIYWGHIVLIPKGFTSLFGHLCRRLCAFAGVEGSWIRFLTADPLPELQSMGV